MRRDLRSPRPALVSLASTRVDPPSPTSRATNPRPRPPVSHPTVRRRPSSPFERPFARPSSRPPIASPPRASRTRIFALLLPRSILSLADPSSTSTLDALAPMTTSADDHHHHHRARSSVARVPASADRRPCTGHDPSVRDGLHGPGRGRRQQSLWVVPCPCIP